MFSGAVHGDAGQQIGQPLHQVLVERAAAANNQGLALGSAVALHVLRNGQRGKGGEAGLHIGGCRAGRMALQQGGQPAGVEQVAPRALGRWQLKKGLFHTGREQGRYHLAAGRPAAAIVIGVAGVQLAPMVHQRIAGAAVPAANVIAIQAADVGDAADIEHPAQAVRPAKHAVVEGRHQRRALAARSHIAAAEIGHHGDTAQLGQQRGVIELQGVAGAIPKAWLVAHRLAMGANGSNVGRLQLAARQQAVDHLGIAAGQRIASQCGAVQLLLSRAVQCQQLGPQGGVKPGAGVLQHLHAAVLPLGNHTIHTIQRGAGHQANKAFSHRGSACKSKGPNNSKIVGACGRWQPLLRAAWPVVTDSRWFPASASGRSGPGACCWPGCQTWRGPGG